MADHSEETEKMAKVLETAAREFGRHSGPSSDHDERQTFGRDLRTAALRFARAYYAEARELGLIPEYSITCNNTWGPHRCALPPGHAGHHFDGGRFNTWE